MCYHHISWPALLLGARVSYWRVRGNNALLACSPICHSLSAMGIHCNSRGHSGAFFPYSLGAPHCFLNTQDSQEVLEYFTTIMYDDLLWCVLLWFGVNACYPFFKKWRHWHYLWSNPKWHGLWPCDTISMVLCKTAVTPLLMYRSYCSLALSHRYDVHELAHRMISSFSPK